MWKKLMRKDQRGCRMIRKEWQQKGRRALRGKWEQGKEIGRKGNCPPAPRFLTIYTLLVTITWNRSNLYLFCYFFTSLLDTEFYYVYSELLKFRGQRSLSPRDQLISLVQRVWFNHK